MQSARRVAGHEPGDESLEIPEFLLGVQRSSAGRQASRRHTAERGACVSAHYLYEVQMTPATRPKPLPQRPQRDEACVRAIA